MNWKEKRLWSARAWGWGLLLFLSGCGAPEGVDQLSTVRIKFNPVAVMHDWTIERDPAAKAVKSVHFDRHRALIDVRGSFDGRNLTNATGRIYLDLLKVPELEHQMPLDFRRQRVKILVDIPKGFSHQYNFRENEAPNGVQFFVKDTKGLYKYGIRAATPRRVIYPDRQELWCYYRPTAMLNARQEKGFQAERVAGIGFNFYVSHPSELRYDGPLYIKKVEFDPPVHITRFRQECKEPRLFSEEDTIRVEEGIITLNGQRWFMVGANWDGIGYAANFGIAPWEESANGFSLRENYVKYYLDYARRSGIKLLRINLLGDGRNVLTFEGGTTGYNATFRKDVQTLLDLALEHDVRIEFILMDATIAGSMKYLHGVPIRGHRSLIVDEWYRKAFYYDFLSVFLKDFGDHPAWISTDIISEPDWFISVREGGGWAITEEEAETGKISSPFLTSIPLRDLQRFIRETAAFIKSEQPDMLVTVGVSSKHWELLYKLPVDFYSLHHYPETAESMVSILKKLPMDKPWVLSEFPTKDEKAEPHEYLEIARENGAAGACLWNFKAGLDRFTYHPDEQLEKHRAIRRWADRHHHLVFPGVKRK